MLNYSSIVVPILYIAQIPFGLIILFIMMSLCFTPIVSAILCSICFLKCSLLGRIRIKIYNKVPFYMHIFNFTKSIKLILVTTTNHSNHPLVSIILCTYNGEAYLDTQLESIFKQTYPNIEIIAIDDCSIDKTFDILSNYTEKHKNLKIFRNTTNIGYIQNFEKAMLMSNGHFIAPCDQDDVWDINKIKIMVENIDNYSMIYCNSELVDANLNTLHKTISDIKNSRTYENGLPFVIANCVSGHALLMKKELLHFAIPFPNHIIYDHWLAYIASIHSGVKYIDDVLVKYRNHDKNTIGAVQMRKKKRKNICAKWKEKKELIKIRREKVKLFYNTCSAERMEKKVLFDLMMSYQSFSLKNNIKRVQIFLKHRKQLLAIKKRSALRKWFFCFKMFFKIK